MFEKCSSYELTSAPEQSLCLDLELQNLLESTWAERHDASIGFRYNLQIERERVADGKFNFVILLNQKRMKERRKPQAFQLDAPFDPLKFNFTRVDPAEVQLELIGPSTLTTILINNSPVTLYHSLIVPERMAQHSQLLTLAGARVSFELLLRLPDRRYRIGYNSPGAQASVNHLHLHLLHIDRNLYVQRAELIPVHGIPLLHRLADHLPAKGYCFVMKDSTKDLESVCSGLMKMIELLVERQMAHNLFWTWSHLQEKDTENEMRVLIFPRVYQCVNKVACSFNAAFLELCGFVSVGEMKDFERLTEDDIVQALRDAQGDVYGRLNDVFPVTG